MQVSDDLKQYAKDLKKTMLALDVDFDLISFANGYEQLVLTVFGMMLERGQVTNEEDFSNFLDKLVDGLEEGEDTLQDLYQVIMDVEV